MKHLFNLVLASMLLGSCGLNHSNFTKQKFTSLKAIDSKESTEQIGENRLIDKDDCEDIAAIAQSSIRPISNEKKINIKPDFIGVVSGVNKKASVSETDDQVAKPKQNEDSIRVQIDKAIANGNPIILEMFGQRIWMDEPTIHDETCLDGILKEDQNFQQDKLLLKIKNFDSLTNGMIHVNCEDIEEAVWLNGIGEAKTDRGEDAPDSIGRDAYVERKLYIWMGVMYILAAIASVFGYFPGIPFYLVAFICSLFLLRRLRSTPRKKRTKSDKWRVFFSWEVIVRAIGHAIFWLVVWIRGGL